MSAFGERHCKAERPQLGPRCGHMQSASAFELVFCTTLNRKKTWGAARGQNRTGRDTSNMSTHDVIRTLGQGGLEHHRVEPRREPDHLDVVRFFRSLIVTRLWAFLVALALAVVPFSMQSDSAVAMPLTSSTAAAMSHCAEGTAGKQKPMSRSECMAACAALPALHPPLASPREPTRPAVAALPILPLTGVEAEAETPPPRS